MEKHPEKGQTCKKLENLNPDFLTIKQVAEMLGKSQPTIRRLCESGDIPSIAKPYGATTTYKIPFQGVAYYLQKQLHPTKLESPVYTKPALFGQITPWRHMVLNGGIYGKPYSKKTIKDYEWFIDRFCGVYTDFDKKGVRLFLTSFPSHQETTKEHAYKAMVSFGKYLAHEEQIEPSVLDEIKAYRPKRRTAPKRDIPTTEEVEVLLNAKAKPDSKLIILILVYTGLRAHEVAQLRWEKIWTYPTG